MADTTYCLIRTNSSHTAAAGHEREGQTISTWQQTREHGKHSCCIANCVDRISTSGSSVLVCGKGGNICVHLKVADEAVAVLGREQVGDEVHVEEDALQQI
jgi:hypothetical protein